MQPITKFLSGNISETGSEEQIGYLRTRSMSGTFYSSMLVVHPSESESDLNDIVNQAEHVTPKCNQSIRSIVDSELFNPSQKMAAKAINTLSSNEECQNLQFEMDSVNCKAPVSDTLTPTTCSILQSTSVHSKMAKTVTSTTTVVTAARSLLVYLQIRSES